jgi:hypothetical protein
MIKHTSRSPALTLHFSDEAEAGVITDGTAQEAG